MVVSSNYTSNEHQPSGAPPNPRTTRDSYDAKLINAREQLAQSRLAPPPYDAVGGGGDGAPVSSQSQLHLQSHSQQPQLQHQTQKNYYSTRSTIPVPGGGRRTSRLLESASFEAERVEKLLERQTSNHVEYGLKAVLDVFSTEAGHPLPTVEEIQLCWSWTHENYKIEIFFGRVIK